MITKKGREVLTSVIAGKSEITDSWVIEIGSSSAAEDENQLDLVAEISGGHTSSVSIERKSYLTTDDTIMISGEIVMAADGTIREVGLRDSSDNLILRKLVTKAYLTGESVIISVFLTPRYGYYEG
jgi:hypothetical protein